MINFVLSILILLAIIIWLVHREVLKQRKEVSELRTQLGNNYARLIDYNNRLKSTINAIKEKAIVEDE